ncbi:MAG: hypothetical protein M0P61_04035 [Ignavibacteriaceae bacterium]|jgi:hypothetical protein|nr:hypothetical protein [Ignavibacteriaceae bacterium]
MNDNKIVIGIFENELYAIIAKRELREAGINANILKQVGGIFLPFVKRADGVPLMVPNTQAEEAKKILQTKFI